MRKFTLFFTTMLAFSVYLNAQEMYTAMKVKAERTPVIDGTIDEIWDEVEMADLLKVPKDGDAVHANITVPEPDEADFSASFGLLWNEDGLFILFRVTDDEVVIEDDYAGTSAQPADQWWTDDNINVLFSKDLTNTAFSQWEFAWQYNIDQEEKLSTSDWANDALIDISLVESAWFEDGTTYALETFIDWEAFADGSATITDNMKIYLEARARDDDDGGAWESMFQWSTDNYQVESSGEGLGEVTLSAEYLEVGINNLYANTLNSSLYPGISNGNTTLKLNAVQGGNVNVSVFSVTGKVAETYAFSLNAGMNQLALDMTSLANGIYMIHVEGVDGSADMKFVKY